MQIKLIDFQSKTMNMNAKKNKSKINESILKPIDLAWTKTCISVINWVNGSAVIWANIFYIHLFVYNHVCVIKWTLMSMCLALK